MGTGVIVIGVGASAGLGAALCRRFGREGMHVFPAGRTAERIEAAAAEVRALGGSATPVITDATRPESVTAIFERVERETGAPPRVVLYNAGNNAFAPLSEMSDAFFEELWRVCCFGAFLVGREVARRLPPRGEGTVIFTGATASLRARPPFTAFASAKAAERALAAGMARELGPMGIHVAHVIVDGIIDGEQVASRFPQLIEERGPDGVLSPDHIADAFFALHAQPRSAWSFELDLRPYKESF
jgi:NAD(P)-dependent dehydrogenase (short-subunit alcohol dehydrogenase family)